MSTYYIGSEFSSNCSYTFDDFLLEPQFSDIDSRSEVDISSEFCGQRLACPVIPANMDSVTGNVMGVALRNIGQVPMYHRYMNESLLRSIDSRVDGGWKTIHYGIPSIGVKGKDLEMAQEFFKRGVTAICIDVAHGHQAQVGRMIEAVKNVGYTHIVAGNVATYHGAKYLAECGAAYVKTGVGGGSRCQTREVTGHGVSQMTAIMEAVNGVRDSKNPSAQVIADGGIKTPGDIAKALAAGAHYVMSGYLFAGCDETPLPGTYRGMASREVQTEYRGVVSNTTPEGVSMAVDSKGPVKDVFAQISGGLRSALSYSGCRTLEEFREGAILRLVSSHTVIENGVRK